MIVLCSFLGWIEASSSAHAVAHDFKSRPDRLGVVLEGFKFQTGKSHPPRRTPSFSRPALLRNLIYLHLTLRKQSNSNPHITDLQVGLSYCLVVRRSNSPVSLPPFTAPTKPHHHEVLITYSQLPLGEPSTDMELTAVDLATQQRDENASATSKDGSESSSSPVAKKGSKNKARNVAKNYVCKRCNTPGKLLPTRVSNITQRYELDASHDRSPHHAMPNAF